MRWLALVLPILGCWTSHHDRRSPPTAQAPQPHLQPVVLAAPPNAGCPLAWDELDEVAPPRLPVRDWANRTDDDECPTAFDISAPCADCVSGPMADHHAARLAVEGPAGTGRFVSLGLAIDHRRFVCTMGSTVGWRHLHDFASTIAPLPWLADVDHDGSRELVVWQRLAWGNAESENGLVPIVYVLDDGALVRRDDRARSVAAPVAAAYRKLAAAGGDEAACYTAMVAALVR